MSIRIKPWEGCFHLPEYKTAGAAGADCYAAQATTVLCGEAKKIPLGFAIELPPGKAAFMLPRSTSIMHGFAAYGLIDSDYRGQVHVFVQYFGIGALKIERGDRICQMVIQSVDTPKFDAVDQLTETERGEGGFGSTNNQLSKAERDRIIAHHFDWMQ
jgi:dUTP pyrophosphatase